MAYITNSEYKLVNTTSTNVVTGKYTFGANEEIVLYNGSEGVYGEYIEEIVEGIDSYFVLDGYIYDGIIQYRVNDIADTRENFYNLINEVRILLETNTIVSNLKVNTSHSDGSIVIIDGNRVKASGHTHPSSDGSKGESWVGDGNGGIELKQMMFQVLEVGSSTGSPTRITNSTEASIDCAADVPIIHDTDYLAIVGPKKVKVLISGNYRVHPSVEIQEISGNNRINPAVAISINGAASDKRTRSISFIRNNRIDLVTIGKPVTIALVVDDIISIVSYFANEERSITAEDNVNATNLSIFKV